MRRTSSFMLQKDQIASCFGHNLHTSHAIRILLPRSVPGKENAWGVIKAFVYLARSVSRSGTFISILYNLLTMRCTRVIFAR